ncbi:MULTISPECIES: caspase family protein [unclassified Mesorhizobium]|uniref:caspase family protein n=1 Tax=unclassified Mesorhizobium TaxID=325217 RepID=UPI001FEE5821|nr:MULTISPECIES: caspase family protein [unclassified Mesorhizobium]
MTEDARLRPGVIIGIASAQVIAAPGPLSYFSSLLDARSASQARFLAVLADCEVFNRPRCRKLRSCGRRAVRDFAMLRCCSLIAALIVVGLTTVQACADRRVALVIGNSEYREIPALKNPDKDAEDVSNTFRLAGFDVFVAKDLTKLQFEKELSRGDGGW